MIFDHTKEDYMEIKFSFVERLNILLKGKLMLNKKSAYQFSAHFLRLISEATLKYGDIKTHGSFSGDDVIDTK
jgi:hypothetical protein